MAKKKRSTQISHRIGNDTLREIKKHSSMVQMTNVTTMQERKVMNALIWIAKDILKRETNSTQFLCELWILKRLCGLNDTNNKELKDALRNLANTEVEYNIFNKDRKEWGVFHVLAEAKISEGGRGKPTFVHFEFPSTVLAVVKNPNMYVRLDLLIIRDLKSKHSIALYEFLKDYQKLGQFLCGIEEFRYLMGIQPGQYEIITMLKKRVLNVAVKEINEKTDLKVDCNFEKEGRKTIAINFIMKKQKTPWALEEKSTAILNKLLWFWIKKVKAEELIKNHDEQYLRANIGIVEEQAKKWKISNLPAYLLKAFQDDYRPIETELDRAKKVEEANKALAKKEKQSIQAEIDKIKIQFNKEKEELMEKTLANTSSDDLQKLQDEFIAWKASSPLIQKLIEARWFTNPIVDAQRKHFLTQRFLPDEYADFGAYLEAIKFDPMKNMNIIETNSTN